MRLNVAAAVALVAVAAAATGRAATNTISDLSWTVDEAGRTVVVVTGAQPFDGRQYRSYHLTDPPRAVVLVSGIDSPYLPGSLTLDDRNVTTVRIGHHPEVAPPELHIVFDLTSDAVEIRSVTHERERLTVLLGPPGGQPAVAETPVPGGARDRPPPPDPLPPREQPAPQPPATVPPTPAGIDPAVAAPEATEPVATHVIDIIATSRGDGSTLLRVTADGRLPEGCARYLKVADTPPRVVLSIRGVSAPELPRSIETGDPILTRIRLIHEAEVTDGELHLVLHLADAAVTVAELKQIGPHLVLRLVGAGTPSPAP
jgi:hypothetical protein